MRTSVVALALAGGLAVAACHSDSPPKDLPSLGEAFPNFPIPPGAQVTGKSGGPDVLQVTMTTPLAPERVMQFYRSMFSQPGWVITSDTRDSSGALVMLAQTSGGRPTWVRVSGAADGGSTVAV